MIRSTFFEVYRRKRRLQRDLLTAVKELGPLNRDPEFAAYREKHLELIFTVLMTAGIYFVLGWQLLDWLTGRPDLHVVLAVRITAAIFLIAMYSLYLLLWQKVPMRYFIYSSFYIGAFFSPFISFFTGGLDSPYWIELVFLLFAWFVLIPFSYRKLAVHALIYIAIYSVILFVLVHPNIKWLSILEHAFVFSAVYVMGMIVAAFNNIFSATVFRSEQKIKKSEERFRMFTQNSLDVVWTMEMKNRTFTYVSPSVYNLRGFRPEELLGKPVIDSLTPASRIQVEEMLARAVEEFKRGNTENIFVGEMEQFTKSGNTVWIEVIASFITDKEGNIVEIMGDSRNITERKKAENELLRVQEKLKQESILLQEENLRIQYESLKSQINPHFLFNSINVLTSLIKVDPDLAEKFAEQMAKVYRYVLEHREEDTVSLRTETDFLNSYVFLLEIRFTDKIRVNISVPDQQMELKVPPLTVQLLVENAVKHNIFSRRKPLRIEVFIDGDMYLNVVNNLNKREVRMGSTGVGLANIESRFGQLTSKPLFFGEDNGRYVARIPLLT
jgi:PAS domain S-box-containing protein